MSSFPVFIPGGMSRGERDTLRGAARGAERVAQDAEQLQAELSRLTLACAALWSLLKEHGHTDEQLLARMEELDLRDGKLDGRMAPEAITCVACQRKTKPGRRTCLYCGSDLPAGPAFGVPA
jgi:hypothetical protein